MSKKEKATPIDVESIDLDLMKERTTDLPGLVEYAHSIGGFSVIPNEEGAIKGQAMTAMKEQTEMHMHQIYEQMQVLARQASKLKKRAEVSVEIYHAQMRFKPVIAGCTPGIRIFLLRFTRPMEAHWCPSF